MGLRTDHPVALQALLNETLFFTADDVPRPEKAESSFQTVDPTPLQAPVVELKRETQQEFVFQGAIEKGIVFILRYEAYDYFSPGAQDAFEKIMGAVGLSPQDVAVVNLANAHNPNDFKRIMAFFKPTKIILLGVEPASLVLPAIPHNSYMKGRIATVFNTYSFEEMFVDVEKKKAFWGEFKKFIAS